MICRFTLLFILIFVFSCQDTGNGRDFIGIKMNPVYERDMSEWAFGNKEKMNEPAPWYPVKIHLAGVWSRAEIRIRGDVARHWKNLSRSFRVRLKNSSWKGMTEFDLIIPEDKGFELEAVAYEWASLLNISSPYYEFADVQINHKKLGAYFVVERWTDSSFIKRNHQPGEVISENNAWLNTINPGFESLYKNVAVQRDSFNPLSLEPAIYTTSYKRTQSQIAMSKFSNMLDEMKKGEGVTWEKYIDRESSAKWAALLIYMGSIHGSFGDNVRWLYSFENKSFSPVIYDVLAYPRQITPAQCLSEPFIRANAWIAYWMRNSYLKERIQFWVHWLSKNPKIDFGSSLKSVSKKYNLMQWTPSQMQERQSIFSRIQRNITEANEHLKAGNCL